MHRIFSTFVLCQDIKQNQTFKINGHDLFPGANHYFGQFENKKKKKNLFETVLGFLGLL